jgi:hypothetical protein
MDDLSQTTTTTANEDVTSQTSQTTQADADFGDTLLRYLDEVAPKQQPKAPEQQPRATPKQPKVKADEKANAKAKTNATENDKQKPSEKAKTSGKANGKAEPKPNEKAKSNAASKGSKPLDTAVTQAPPLSTEQATELLATFEMSCDEVLRLADVMTRAMACCAAQQAWEKLYPWTRRGPGIKPCEPPDGASETRTYVAAIAVRTKRPERSVRLDCEIGRGITVKHVREAIQASPLRSQTRLLHDLSRLDFSEQSELLRTYQQTLTSTGEKDADRELSQRLAARRKSIADTNGSKSTPKDTTRSEGALLGVDLKVNVGGYNDLTLDDGRRLRVHVEKVHGKRVKTFIEVLPAKPSATVAET